MSSPFGAQRLGPAPRRVLADEVTDALRNAIVAGQFVSGQRLVEDELATELSVSRGPVREALLRLSQEGLVVIERHRGATVAALSSDEVDEIYSLRTSLERLAVEWLCLRGSDADFDEIENVLIRFDDLPLPLKRADVARLDVDFHDAIFRGSHHGRLQRAWDGLRSQSFVYLIQRGALRSDFAATWRQDHAALLATLRTRKRAVAVKAIESHIKATVERVLAMDAEVQRAQDDNP